MIKLIRYYNQNRKKIWKIILIIFSAFLLLQIVNYFYKIKDEEQKLIPKNQTSEINSTNTTTITENKSVVTGKKVQKDTLQTAVTIIDTFKPLLFENDFSPSGKISTTFAIFNFTFC